MSRQAVILAGGKGTRLAARLGDKPKALVDVDGQPLLLRQLHALRAHGFTRVVLLVQYRKEAIETFLAETPDLGVDVRVIEDGEPRGTAGAVIAAAAELDERFLVVYGDTLFDIDLTTFWQAHEGSGAEGTLFLHPNDHPHDSDLVEIDDAKRVSAFRSKPHPPGASYRNLVNAALYVLEKRLVMAYDPGEGISDFGANLFPDLLKRGHRLSAYVSFEYIKDVGTPERLDRAENDLRKGKIARARLTEPQKAVFLDRDGTLNIEKGHLNRADQLELIPGAAEAVRCLNKAEFRTVVVTNQPVLARGETSFEEMERIHARLETLLGQKGGFLDGLYLCPHHPDSGFSGEVSALKIRCACRKPGLGMIEDARKALNIDLSRSWIIGDRTVDIEAGRRAGLTTVLVRTGDAGRDNLYPGEPDYEVADLEEAAWLISQGEAEIEARLAPALEKLTAGMLVQIGGQSRSGKSLVANGLRRALLKRKIPAASLSLDHWLTPLGQRAQGAGVADRYDLTKAETDLATWLNGGALDLSYKRYDRLTRGPLAKPARLDLAADGVLILEGVLGLKIQPSARKPLRIFVKTAEETRKARLIREYCRGRGHSEAEAITIYEDRLAEEIPTVEATRMSTDFVLDLSPSNAGQ